LPSEGDDSDDSPKEKKKGIRGALQSLKRRLSDRSPDQPAPSTSTRRTRLVGVIVPPPPFPHSSYKQLGASSSSAITPSILEEPVPPVSSSPSLASFDSGRSSDPHFEVRRLSLLLSGSQEELRLRDAQFAERERRTAELYEKERAMYLARIRKLEGQDRDEADGGSRRGGTPRRGGGGSGSRHG
jgi:hypothetical protein